MLSHGRARSSRIARAIHPGSRGPCAACRLLQSIRSTSTTARSTKPRTPRPGSPPSAAPARSLSDGFRRLPPSCGTGWPRLCRSAASRDVTGQGQLREINPFVAPSTTIAHDGNLTPTRSARAPPCRERAPAQAWRYLRRGDPPKRASTCSPGRALLSQSHRRLGPPLASPREREHGPPHPRCLPSTGFPRRVDNLRRPPLPAWRSLESDAFLLLRAPRLDNAGGSPRVGRIGLASA
jgi:hypothetical protein